MINQASSYANEAFCRGTFVASYSPLCKIMNQLFVKCKTFTQMQVHKQQLQILKPLINHHYVTACLLMPTLSRHPKLDTEEIHAVHQNSMTQQRINKQSYLTDYFF
jgi:hypothetical protein